jgi:hypothetical protein
MGASFIYHLVRRYSSLSFTRYGMIMHPFGSAMQRSMGCGDG